MIYYLTYNEPFSGIYNSQVIDVVKHLRQFHKVNIRLIAFLPIGFNVSNFKILKNKIRKLEPTSIIIPTVPVQYGWKFNWLLLSFVLMFRKKRSIISREIFATYIVSKCKKIKLVKKSCHDGRGASLAQMKEYDIYPEKTKKDMLMVEPYSVNVADFRLAVSNSLVNYWKENFNYTSNRHVVIPCTISGDYFNNNISQQQIDKVREKYNFSIEDIILVFSGSTFGWQSFEIISKFCTIQLENNNRVKIMFLSQSDDSIIQLKNEYPQHVFCEWLAIEDVIPFLMACDYGLLLRESNDTNNVASPTKFAEYLAAGLPVIISDNLEFSQVVKKENCGLLINNDDLKQLELNRVDLQKKIQMRKVAEEFFLKSSPINTASYNLILNNIN